MVIQSGTTKLDGLGRRFDLALVFCAPRARVAIRILRDTKIAAPATPGAVHRFSSNSAPHLISPASGRGGGKTHCLYSPLKYPEKRPMCELINIDHGSTLTNISVIDGDRTVPAEPIERSTLCRNALLRASSMAIPSAHPVFVNSFETDVFHGEQR
ncbi:hypothetical protein ACFPTO_19040 [Paraburkholderia denitrificans]|uniref:Uncharacterized protein n=1 Tax=Paraburkholderia denitrificans TaxID=694025 RepID=A0ABW0JCI6_9BURK